jgi:hypothetical protein
MLRFSAEATMAEHYASVLADYFHFPLVAGHAYEPPGQQRPRAGCLYVPAVYGFPTCVKAFSWKSRFDLYFMDDPVTSKAVITCYMAGEAWPEDDLLALCRRLQDLPFGGEVTKKIIEEADWLDANPMYRLLPRIADRHIPPGQLEVGKPKVEKPKDWDWN